MEYTSRRELQKSTWARVLAGHGLNTEKLLAGEIRDDRLASACERAGLPELAVIQVLKLFNHAGDEEAVKHAREATAEDIEQERLDNIAWLNSRPQFPPEPDYDAAARRCAGLPPTCPYRARNDAILAQGGAS